MSKRLMYLSESAARKCAVLRDEREDGSIVWIVFFMAAKETMGSEFACASKFTRKGVWEAASTEGFDGTGRESVETAAEGRVIALMHFPDFTSQRHSLPSAPRV